MKKPKHAPAARGRALLLVMIVAAAMALGACSFSTTMSYTFTVSTGDEIKVSLDTTDGYWLAEEDSTFSVEKDDEVVLQGIFLNEEMYNEYMDRAKSGDITVISEGSQGDNPYFYYQAEVSSGTTNQILLWINDSQTGIMLASLSPREDVEPAFERLSFSKK